MFIYVEGEGYWSASKKAFVPLRAQATQYADVAALTLDAERLPEGLRQRYEIQGQAGAAREGTPR